jgi:hypothetical protein
MRSALLLLVSVALLGSGACRPSGDRVEATKSGAIATGGTASRGNGDPVAKGAEKATPETLPNNLVVAEDQDRAERPAAPASNAAQDNSVEAATAATIPAAYQGRWGMVAADCDPGRSDNKGLLTIGDRTLRFYESLGTLKEQRPAVATGFAGLYDFTGEGETWQKVIVFTREGSKLTRAEDGQRYTYTRCA